jgi:hypothetical protein
LKIVNHQGGHFSINFLGHILKLTAVPARECFEAFKRADLDRSLLFLEQIKQTIEALCQIWQFDDRRLALCYLNSKLIGFGAVRVFIQSDHSDGFEGGFSREFVVKPVLENSNHG